MKTYIHCLAGVPIIFTNADRENVSNSSSFFGEFEHMHIETYIYILCIVVFQNNGVATNNMINGTSHWG